MLAIGITLFACPLVAYGHVHILGVPVVTWDLTRRYGQLFVPIDPNFCNAQEQQTLVLCLRGSPQGTPYCSSFLNILTATV
jgi:hypothetical protein